MGWQHKFIKYYLIVLIFMIIGLDSTNADTITSILAKYSSVTLMIGILVIVINIIYLYAVYEYVGILDNTKCKCAVYDMKILHNILYYVRYIMLFIAVILAIYLLATIPIIFLNVKNKSKCKKN